MLDLSNSVSISARVEPEHLPPGGRGRLIAAVSIPDGWHIQSNEPRQRFLVPAVLRVDARDGLRIGEISYPTAEEMRLDWSPIVLTLYRGAIEFSAPLEADRGAESGSYRLSGTLSYQACTENLCFPPSGQRFDVVLVLDERAGM